MTTDDSMDDDVFESQDDIDNKLHIESKNRQHPSPTGYKNYQPPPEVLKLCETNVIEDTEPVVHKTILLGDSGVGKTSLLVKFDTGKFQSGNFSATVGIGFTIMETETCNSRRIVKVRPSIDYQDEDIMSPTIVNEEELDYDKDPYLLRRKESIKSDEPGYDFFGKVMLLGDSGVGKTCILMRFRDGQFLGGNFISTVGVDFRNKVITVDHTKVKLQIWDTAGQERFRSVTHAYYRDAHALLLLYDVTNKTSYDNIRAWLGEIREYAQDDVVIMLLGNKADCGSDRAVRREEGERLAREYNVAFMETSAKSGQNVDLAFLAIARELKFRQTGQKPDNNKFCVQDYVREQTTKSSCPPCIT